MEELFRVNLSTFFDRQATRDAIGDRKKQAALWKMGAFIFRKARGLVRPGGKKRKTSSPGQAPRDHGFYRKTILFGYDAGNDSVVVGARADVRGARQTPKVPEVLEFGGTVHRSEPRYIRDDDGKGYIELPAGAHHYEARPHMFPALESEIDKFPGLLAETSR